MARAVERLQEELAAVRSGRASVGMLAHIKAEAYGERMPLASLATVLVRDSQLLSVTVFDPAVRTSLSAALPPSSPPFDAIAMPKS